MARLRSVQALLMDGAALEHSPEPTSLLFCREAAWRQASPRSCAPSLTRAVRLVLGERLHEAREHGARDQADVAAVLVEQAE